MTKILMIPHAPQVKIRTRALELSRSLATSGLDVDLYIRQTQPLNISNLQKLQWHFSEISSGFKLTEAEQHLQTISTPTFHRFLPLIRFSNWFSARVLMTYDYDLILTSAYTHLFFEKRKSYQLIYDLVDDHADGYRRAGQLIDANTIEAFMSRQIAESDCMIASSQVLVELAKMRYQREALYIPNGANVTLIRSLCIPRTGQAESFRVGYIGGLDQFVRIDIVFEAIAQLRHEGIEIELVVVGEGPAIQDLPAVDWLHLLGFKLPDEIPTLLSTFTIGIIPFDLTPLTDAALPLKAIEYGAAQCITISSPIRELQIQQLPWIDLVPLDIDLWKEALKRAIATSWQSEWDGVVDQFDWGKITAHLRQSLNF